MFARLIFAVWHAHALIIHYRKIFVLLIFAKPTGEKFLNCENFPIYGIPVSLQSGQLLSEVLYLHFPLLPGDVCLKLLRKIHNKLAHHHTMMYTPYQNYNPMVCIKQNISHLLSFTREQGLKVLICAPFSSELQTTGKVTHICTQFTNEE